MKKDVVQRTKDELKVFINKKVAENPLAEKEKLLMIQFFHIANEVIDTFGYAHTEDTIALLSRIYFRMYFLYPEQKCLEMSKQWLNDWSVIV